jgi:hypothetical protein
MVMASTNSTDGSAFPKDMEEPRSFTGFPLKATWVPGCAEAQSKGIWGRLVAQPKTVTKSKLTRMIRLFFKTI